MVQVMQTEAEDLVALLHELADRSGPAILPWFRSALAVDDKSGGGVFDPVTEADRAGERAIVSLLEERRPLDSIYGEELGRKRGDSDFEWVIDPIDGTRAFVCGAPTWGTLIGLRNTSAAVLGVMDQPYTRERFWGGKHGSFARQPDGTEIRLRANRTKDLLSEAFLSSTSPQLFSEPYQIAGFAAIRETARVTRYGLDCYAYCLLASGTLDVIVESDLKPYDIVALVPIIEAAGGVVTNWEGGSPLEGGDIAASANQKLHEQVLSLLGRHPR